MRRFAVILFITVSTVYISSCGGGTATPAQPGPTPSAAFTGSLSPFGNQRVGSTSHAATVFFFNPGLAPLSITSVTASGDFAETNNCGTSLAVGANCLFSVTFTPTATGTRTGTLSVTDNAANSPQTLALTGTGTTVSATLSLTSLVFASQVIGNVSALQTVTLTSSGTDPLTVTGITATDDFAQTNTCGASVAPGANCTILVTFNPTATGSLSGSVVISDNASGGPQTISLTGTGTSPACSTSTLNGSYRALVGGTVVGVGPLARIILLDFDGSGNGTAHSTASVNGVITTSFGGTGALTTYTVNADCSGTVTFTAAGAHFNLVIVPNGARFFFIRTDPGNVVSGQAIRLDQGDEAEVTADADDLGCSNSTLKGSYRATGGGTIVGVGPIAIVNGVVLDGSGNGQTFGVTQSVNGNIVTPPPGPVTYTVNADCTGTATFPAGNFNIVVDKKGAGWFYISTAPGRVVSGYTIRLDEDDEGTADADDLGCSASTLSGGYRAIGSGTVGITGPGTGVPIDVVNNLNLDGSGNGQVTAATFAVNGNVSTGTLTVTYTVNADCTGTTTFTPSSGPAAHFNIVVDKEGAGFFFIQTDSGNAVTGRVVRLDEDDQGTADADDLSCSASTLSGSYRFFGTGTVLGVGPVASINGVVMDGSGNGQTFAFTRSVNGNIVTLPGGPTTYTVNADCTGTFGGGAFNIVVDRHGDGWFAIKTGPGSQVSGYSIRF